MQEGFAHWANASSPHSAGRRAKAMLEDARARVKAMLDWDGEVIFTSGASEAATLALTRAKAGARLVSAVEHDAILAAAPQAERLPVLPDGRVDPGILRSAVDLERPLVAIQTVNSETGAMQDMDEVAEIVHDAGGLLVADASQSAGRLPIPALADMVVVSAHKLGGPIGIGALLLRDFGLLEPSGGHERGYRRGTENMPAALGFAAALEAGERWLDPEVEDALALLLPETVASGGGEMLADRLWQTVPHIAAIAMPGMSAQAQLMRFDMGGIAVSQGSACSSGTMKSSPVLKALGLDEDIAARTIRASFGWTTTRADVERFCEVWLELAGGSASKG